MWTTDPMSATGMAALRARATGANIQGEYRRSGPSNTPKLAITIIGTQRSSYEK
jgi:hypothetical protein